MKRRTLSALLLAPVFLGVIFLGPIPFVIGVGVLGVLAARELAGLLSNIGGNALTLLPVTTLVLFVAAILGILGPVEIPLVILTGFALLLWLFRPEIATPGNGPAMAWGFHLVGALYLGFLPAYLARLHAGPWDPDLVGPDGPGWVLLAVFLVWACDTGAYLCGKTLGRHPLWKAVSPAKTIEGACGGLVLATGVAVWIGPKFAPGLSFREALALGLLAAIGAQLGDLIQSRIKRTAGVKDSGQLIPGHGGILDRFDSLFFAAPLFYYYLRAFAR